MKTHDVKHELEMRAAAALKAALAEVSTIKVREIRHESSRKGHDSCLMVSVDLFGRRHTLACEIHADGQPRELRSKLEGMRAGGAERDDVMPIIVAPYLSPEAQTLCKENKTGFVDLEGNARLALGEVFIVKRTLPHSSQRRPVSTVQWSPASMQKLPEKVTVRTVAAHRGAMQPVVA